VSVNNFDDFPENQITEFHGEFPNFIHSEFGMSPASHLTGEPAKQNQLHGILPVHHK